MTLPDPNQRQSVEIAAGALYLCVDELDEKAGFLRPGEVRDAWVDAAKTIREALDKAAATHRQIDHAKEQ